jgi:hypothetical protein
MLIHVAAVFSAGGVHFLTAAPSASELNMKLAGYVEQQVEWSLQDDDARQVRNLLHAGEFGEAVRLYFERVGERWEKESLRVEVVPAGANGTDHHGRWPVATGGGA